MHWLFIPILSLLVSVQSLLLAFRVKSRSRPYDKLYYEYFSRRLDWKAAEELCEQQSGTLATVSNSAENQQLTSILKYWNISHPVWIGRKILTHQKKDSSMILILDFSRSSNQTYVRLLHKFPSMSSVTICTQLRFNPNSFGISTIFSHSVNDFQLRANLAQGRPVQLALLIHGKQGSYVEAFEHDYSWHSVCVSWSQDGRRWALYAHGHLVSSGNGVNSNDDIIGPNGSFILGERQNGGSFMSNDSFRGNITELHIWDRVLSSCEILTMENECSTISSGLVLRWSEASLEIEGSLERLQGNSPCQEKFTDFKVDLFSSSLDGTSWQNQTLTVGVLQRKMVHEDCRVFDPVTESCGVENCSSYIGVICQFKKEKYTLPKSPFVSRLSEDPKIRQVMEELSVNTSRDIDLTSLQQLTQAALYAIEADGPRPLTSSDILYLSQVIDSTAASARSAGANTAEVMVSIATNYLNLASMMLEPHMATQWIGWTEDGVNIGPFTIIKSIDGLTEALADTLSAEQRDFTLSTKNIDVYLKWQKLSHKSSNQVFKLSAVTSHIPSRSSHDELIIPDYELQRIYKLGYKEVMFIHTYYSHLSEVVSAGEKPAESQQDKAQSTLPGKLTSAVISSTVRDVSKGQTVPVVVQYTLSSSQVEEYSWRVPRVCAFWNFSRMHSQTSSWSSDGCSVIFVGSGVTSCLCNHTTNFAVLMNYFESKWNPAEELILTKLTFIGCGASLCALVVTLMLFTVLDIPKSDRTSIHKNLFVALICAQVILLCSGSAIHSKVACTLVAALLHLFFMAAFSWMLVEGLLLWSKVVAVNLSEDHHMKYYYLIGWGLPVLIVTITLASASGKYSADDYCWLSVQNGIIWGFVGPVIFIIMVNILVLTRVIMITISTAKRRSIMLALGMSPTEQAYEQIRAAVKAVLVLLPILGLTWVFGVLVPFSIVMAYLFILLNSLQVWSTVNRIKERRKALNFSNCASSRPSSSVTTSRPLSYPLGSTPSQEEEAYPCNNMPCPRMEEERSRGQLTSPCAEESSTLAQLDRKVPPPIEVDALPAGCSLHVPMDVEFAATCYPCIPPP
ncbi:adhesion G-protein coupled receptor D2 isoform X4 [Girardinichthys multiradiatus]|uniref:adhesion G-protein coupled receptor D2 isoform X4 n=1 Tax=Girardinichthys multiradiatus TaxID=208333 RepID=UPI001FAC8E6A|nr:adhesion G-protein coupled receptor D2 isoform X4 [Girardinichthys multiradiatus]